MSISVQIDRKDFQRAMLAVPRRLKFTLGDSFDHIGRKTLSTFRKMRLNAQPWHERNQADDEGIRGRFGGIFSTFQRSSLIGSGIEDMGLMIRSDSNIAVLHEQGGTVTQKGKALAVPIPSNKKMFTATGRLRKSFSNPERIKNSFVIRTKRGNDIIFRRKRGQTKLEPLFVLKDRIHIRKRLGFFKVWDSLNVFRIQRLNRAIDKAFG